MAYNKYEQAKIDKFNALDDNGKFQDVTGLRKHVPADFEGDKANWNVPKGAFVSNGYRKAMFDAVVGSSGSEETPTPTPTPPTNPDDQGGDTSGDNDDSGSQVVETYSAAEAIEYNAGLPGARKEGDEIDSNELVPYEFINDQATWEASYENGILKDYYVWADTVGAYPYKEDLWNEADQRGANWNDIVGVSETGNPQEFEDGYHYVDKNGNACVRCWDGVINAPEAELPWVAISFDTDVNAKVRFDYTGKDSIYPWGDKIFGTAEGHKSWGLASPAKEWNDDSFKLIALGGQEVFDKDNFHITLVHTVTAEEAIEYNANLDGAVKEGDPKSSTVEVQG